MDGDSEGWIVVYAGRVIVAEAKQPLETAKRGIREREGGWTRSNSEKSAKMAPVNSDGK